jgi:hypothetical protein
MVISFGWLKVFFQLQHDDFCRLHVDLDQPSGLGWAWWAAQQWRPFLGAAAPMVTSSSSGNPALAISPLDLDHAVVFGHVDSLC